MSWSNLHQKRSGIMDVFSSYSNCIFVLTVENSGGDGRTHCSSANSAKQRPPRLLSPALMRTMKEKLLKAGVSRIGRYWMTPSIALEVDFSSEEQLEKFVGRLAQGQVLHQTAEAADKKSSSSSSSSSSSPQIQLNLFFIQPDQPNDEVVIEEVTSDNVKHCVASWRRRVTFNMGSLLNWFREAEHSRATGVVTLPQLREGLSGVVGWVRLGLTLHLSLAELQEIHREKGEEGVKKCLIAMLELWMKSVKQQPPMWLEVVEALHLIGYTTVAKRLAMKYNVSVPQSTVEQSDFIKTTKAKQQLQVLQQRQKQLQLMEEEVAQKTTMRSQLEQELSSHTKEMEEVEEKHKKLKQKRRVLEEQIKVTEKELLMQQSEKLEQETMLSDLQLRMVSSEKEKQHAVLGEIDECSKKIEILQAAINKKKESIQKLSIALEDTDDTLRGLEGGKLAQLQSLVHNQKKKLEEASLQAQKLRDRRVRVEKEVTCAEEALDLILIRDEKDQVTKPTANGSQRKESITITSPEGETISEVLDIKQDKDRPASREGKRKGRPTSKGSPASSRESTPNPPYRSSTLPRGRHLSAISSQSSSLEMTVKTSTLKRKFSESGGVRSQLIKPHQDEADSIAESVADSAKCFIGLPASSNIQLDEEVEYTITLRDQYNRPCRYRQIVTAEAKSLVKGAVVPAQVKHISHSICRVTVQPIIRGRHEVMIRVNSRLTGRGPLRMYVTSPLPRIPKPRPTKILNGMRKPWGVAIDSEGRVFVTHPQHHMVSVFSSSWQQQFSIGGKAGEGEGKFDTPRGVATDYHNNIYIADSCNNRVQKLNRNGAFICSSGKGSKSGRVQLPTGIAVSVHDEVHVCDGHAHCIQVYNANLGLIRTLGSKGKGAGQLLHPTGVAIDSNTDHVFVADQGNHRVSVFTRMGELVRCFSCKSGEVWFPTGIAVDTRSSLVYVTDCRHKRIHIFRPDGSHVHAFGQNGTQPGEFCSIGGVAVNRDGFVLVCDDISNRIQQF